MLNELGQNGKQRKQQHIEMIDILTHLYVSMVNTFTMTVIQSTYKLVKIFLCLEFIHSREASLTLRVNKCCIVRGFSSQLTR